MSTTEPWEKGRMLFEPQIEHVRVQVDYSRSDLIIPGLDPQLDLRAKLAVSIVDAIIEHLSSIGL